MNELTQIIISYLIIIFGSLIFFNFLSSGFLLAFIKTKVSRGKKTFLFVRGRTGDYFAVGIIKEDELFYTNRDKIKKIITIRTGQVQRIMNIPFLQIDDVKNAVMNPDFTTASGHDAANVDNLLNRTLMAPSTILEKFIKIILLIVIVIVIITLVCAFLIFTVKKGMPNIQSSCDAAAHACILVKEQMINNAMQTKVL